MQKRTIGVVLESDFEYGVAVLGGIRQAADNLPDWQLVPVMQLQQGFLSCLSQAGKLDGLIAPAMSDRWFESYSGSGRLFVNISSISRVERLPSVVVDDRAAGALVAGHFAEMKLKRVGVVFERAVHSSVLRKEGFCNRLAGTGVEIELPTSAGGYSFEGEWQEWLRTLRGEIAIFGTSDRVVRRFMKHYARISADLKVKIGSVAGVGDSLMERTLSGMDLTSVVLPARRVGIEAVRLMQNLLEGDQRVTRCQVKPDELIVRHSSAGYMVDDQSIAKALGYIDRRLGERFSVDELARFAGMSRRKLEMRFQVELGMAPAAYIRQKRCTLAERLLKESSLPVSEVAMRCAAGSLQSFTAQFKALHGVPPGVFRSGEVRER